MILNIILIGEESSNNYERAREELFSDNIFSIMQYNRDKLIYIVFSV